ncbi:MAG: response regulator [Defluviitaleaceae bacterium]|nr:response regulator [Defluviitaleaceae bacterium]
MDEVRILIADNSTVYKKMFAQGAKETFENVSTASAADGGEAYALIKRNNFDVIIIDAEISGLNLYDLLKVIKVDLPRAYVLIMARPSSANELFFPEATAKGATECMIKPIHGSYAENLAIIKNKLGEINKMIREAASKKDHAKISEQANDDLCGEKTFNPDIVLIAASTGGPSALEKILSQLSASFPVPILVVQHIPINFSENLARDLNNKSKLKVKVAEKDETVSAGTVYIAPGGSHIKLDIKNRVRLDDSPPRGGVRPAADVLFESLAENYGETKILAVILTGMGNDGRDGIYKLKKSKECICLAQSEKTCVVYGMPRAVTEDGMADRVTDLDKIAEEIQNFFICR